MGRRGHDDAGTIRSNNHAGVVRDDAVIQRHERAERYGDAALRSTRGGASTQLLGESRRRQRQLPVLQLHAAGKFFRHRVDRVSHCIERRFRARVDRRGERDGATGERSTDARQHGGGGGDE